MLPTTPPEALALTRGVQLIAAGSSAASASIRLLSKSFACGRLLLAVVLSPNHVAAVCVTFCPLLLLLSSSPPLRARVVNFEAAWGSEKQSTATIPGASVRQLA